MISAVISTAISIIAAILDGQIEPVASSLDGQTEPGELLDGQTEPVAAFLPKLVQKWLSEGLSKEQKEKRKFWRRVLGKLILALADQQLVTGIALLTSAYIILPNNPFSTNTGAVSIDYQDAYFTLVVYLCCLSSSTHLACIITAKRSGDELPQVTKIRIVLIILFSVLLSVSIALSIYAFDPFFRFLYLILVDALGASKRTYRAFTYIVPLVIMLYIFWISIIQLADSLRGKITHSIRLTRRPFHIISDILTRSLGKTFHDRVVGFIKSSFWFFLFSKPWVVFVLQIVLVITSLYFALSQKFTPAPKPNEEALAAGVSSWCSLNNSADNEWGFGQNVPMFLLFLPVLSTVEAYFGEFPERNIRSNSKLSTTEGKTKNKNTFY